MKQLELPFKEKERPRNLDKIMAENFNYAFNYTNCDPLPVYVNCAQTASTANHYTWGEYNET